MLIVIDPEMQWLAEPAGKMDRPAVFSDTAIQLCLSIKVLFKLPLRQAVGMVRALLKLAGLDWPVPDYSTLCRRQKSLTAQIPYRRADGPLNLLVGSTGIKFLGDGEWHAQAWAVPPPPMAQGSPGHGHSHIRHPGRRVHFQPGEGQSDPACPARPDPPGRADRLRHGGLRLRYPTVSHRHSRAPGQSHYPWDIVNPSWLIWRSWSQAVGLGEASDLSQLRFNHYTDTIQA